MSLIRAFVAIEIPGSVQQAILKACQPLKNSLDSAVRWVQPQNIHLTLKFLGDVSPTSLGLLEHSLAAEASQHSPFEIEIGGFSVFPNPKKARVLWIGVQAPPALSQLQHALEACCARLGYPSEAEKPFSPHLTIGRVREGANQPGLRPALEQFQAGSLGKASIQGICLFRSDLQPQGARYTPLAHIPLGITSDLPTTR